MIIPTIASSIVSQLFQQSNQSSSNKNAQLSPFQQLAQNLGATGSSSSSSSSSGSSGLPLPSGSGVVHPVLQRELNTLATEISGSNLSGAKQTLASLRQTLQSSAGDAAAHWSQLTSQFNSAELNREIENPGLSLFG